MLETKLEKRNSLYKQNLDDRDVVIGDIGEKTFLSSVFSELKDVDSRFLNGLNQDAGIIRISSDLLLVSNVDKAQIPIVLAEDKPITYLSWGYLAVTSSLSDICVVGALGVSFLLSLTIPPSMDSEKVMYIIRGAKQACEFYNITFLGGDTKKGKEISVIGVANGIIKSKDNNFLTRQSSKPNDLILSIGEFGKFASAYFKTQKKIQITDDELNYITYPKFSVNEMDIVQKNINLFSASMDNSDGLNNMLYKMFTENGLGYDINLNEIPISESAKELSLEQNIPLENFLFFVGDWNSLFTISEENFRIITKNYNHKFKVIGKVNRDKKSSFFHFNNKSFKATSEYENDSFTSTVRNSNYLLKAFFSKNSILKEVV